MVYRVILSGCCGRMGHMLEHVCDIDPDVAIVAGFDIVQEERNYTVYDTPGKFTGEADVVIDFSNPAALDGLLAFCTERKTPLVLATTGYSEDQIRKIETASVQVPIFRSANMSLGINVLMELVKKAASALGDNYDIEIVERHHNQKVDAPSGTALMIADAASEALNYEPNYVFDRHDVRQKRGNQEIGISSMRGGTIVGVHEIMFAGPDEIIEIKHTAMSREIFANGAVRAAKFLAHGRAPGLYDMSTLVNESEPET